MPNETGTTSLTSPVAHCPNDSFGFAAEVAREGNVQSAIRIIGIDPGLRRTGWGVIGLR